MVRMACFIGYYFLHCACCRQEHRAPAVSQILFVNPSDGFQMA
jgi:hypothetical protein